VSKQALKIEQFSSRMRQFSFNLTALKVLAAYCKDHPNKPGILLYDNTKTQPMDPYLWRVREKDKLLGFFKRFSLHGIVLVNVTQQHYSYLGRYVNGTMLSINIDKEKNGLHVPYLISVILMMEEVQKDYLKNFNQPSVDAQIEEIKTKLEDSAQIVQSSSEDNSLQITKPSENKDDFSATLNTADFFKNQRQVSFKDLPIDLQELILRDTPQTNQQTL
jgi:hypothetical protein